MIGGLLAGTARVLSGAEVRWLGCRPEMRPRIYFANHSSHFDFPVLWAALPRAVRARCRPVAAKDYWQAGALRRYFADEVFNAVLVERQGRAGCVAAIEALLAALDGGSSLILFPEGTRGTGEELGRFRGGLYLLAARRPNVELVPVCIDGLARVLPKGELLPAPLRTTVSFGRPLRLEMGECKAAFLRRAREAVVVLKEGTNHEQ